MKLPCSSFHLIGYAMIVVIHMEDSKHFNIQRPTGFELTGTQRNHDNINALMFDITIYLSNI